MTQLSFFTTAWKVCKLQDWASLYYTLLGSAHQVLVFTIAVTEVGPELLRREGVHEHWIDIMLCAMQASSPGRKTLTAHQQQTVKVGC